VRSAASQGAEISELKQRLMFVFFGLLIFRLGAHIPVPGVNVAKVMQFFSQSKGGVLSLMNMFSGGSLSRLTVFALGVMPYITSSIVMQIGTMMVPKLENLKKEGDLGRRKINQYTRYGALGLSLLQGFGISRWLTAQGLVLYTGFSFYFIATITLSTGTMFLMWLGEQITERGIGNGISLIIFAGIVSRFPQAIAGVLEQVRVGQMQILSMIILTAIIMSIVAFVVFFERAQRRIAINYTRAQHGRGGQAASYVPLKLNMASVIPPIFASSLIVFPTSLLSAMSHRPGFGWMGELAVQLSPGQPLYFLLFISAIVFFSFYYTAIIFNPKDTANELKRVGALLPGIRPGKYTEDYIDNVMSRLTLIGAMYLCFVSLVPEFLIVTWHVPFYFGGTSLLIVVVVVMDFIGQIQSHLLSQKYEKVLGKSGLSTRKR
jgi:preprotein translocase subunit SecY